MQHATIGRDARHEAGPATPAFVAARPALPPAAFDSEVLALLCPDWHDAMMVVDAVTREVAYANIRALDGAGRKARHIAEIGPLAGGGMVRRDVQLEPGSGGPGITGPIRRGRRSLRKGCVHNRPSR